MSVLEKLQAGLKLSVLELTSSFPSSIADNLPVATRLEFYPNREAGGEDEQRRDVAKDVQFEHGYRLGFMDSNKVKTRGTVVCAHGEGPHRPLSLSPQFYLHNHLSFILYFHKEQLEEGNVHNYRVVRFEVVPQSVKVEGR